MNDKNAGTKILLVEDDPIISEGLIDNFKLEGFEIRWENNGQSGIDTALDWQPDLILLDIMMPQKNGYEVLKVLRKNELTCPVIMITAKSEEFDRCLGLDLGADDYVVKPFSLNELLSRVNAQLRRCRQFQGVGAKLSFSNVQVDFSQHQLKVDGQKQSVTTTELAVLRFLSERQGRAVTRDQILDGVWGHGYYGTARTIDNFIHNLRLKIESDPQKPQFLKTIRGIGYMFQTLCHENMKSQ